MPLSSSSRTSPPSLISNRYASRFPRLHGARGRSAPTSCQRWVVRSLCASSDTDAKFVSLRCSCPWGSRSGKRSSCSGCWGTTSVGGTRGDCGPVVFTRVVDNDVFNAVNARGRRWRVQRGGVGRSDEAAGAEPLRRQRTLCEGAGGGLLPPLRLRHGSRQQ
jgi:hypothetical protein